MVFRKYKPVAQWGKQDTRIFKAILNARNARKMPGFKIPDAVKNLGVVVHDPMRSEFFEFNGLAKEAATQNTPLRGTDTHPLYKETPCKLFEGQEPMSDGVDQALLLAQAVLRTEFPAHVLEKSLPEVDENKVRDAILHGERYDATLEKLPRRFDPVLFWVKHPRVHGTPVIKRGNIILDNLFRHIILAAIGNKRLTATQLKVTRDEPFSVAVWNEPYFVQSPLVIRGQPHIAVHQSATAPSRAWATNEEVEQTRTEPLASISPLSPLIDLGSQHIYNEEIVITRKEQREVGLHTLAWTREQDQKYLWTTEQNAANAVLYTYGAAVAEWQRRREGGGESSSSGPIVARGVQLVDGRLDLVAVQLNRPPGKGAEEGVGEMKNIVWMQKGIQLYKPRPFYEQLEQLQEVNMEAVEKLAALLLS